MGFLDDVSNTINNATAGFGNTAQLGPLGLPIDIYNQQRNSQQEQQDLGYAQNRQSASAQNLAGLEGSQQDIANNFNQNANQYKGLLQDQEVKPLRMQMSQKLADTKLDASRRGILNSGIQQRNAANTVSQYKSAYGGALDKAEGNFQNLSNQINSAPINTGLELGGYQQNAQNQYYQYALQNMQAQNALAGGLGQAGGYGLGSYIGGQQKQNQLG